MVDAFKCQVIEISRGTTHDGPGLRTTVFLKGCPLRCRWCQNPEGISAHQEIWWEARKCIHCLACLQACPTGAIVDEAGGLRVDRAKCSACGACVEACPSTAMSFTGQEWTLEALLNEVLKDQDYYRAFGGGVTVSGGEPLSQFRFVAEFFRRLRAAGVNTALDTCGLASSEALQAVLPHTDHVLFDIKLMDSQLHQQFTGQPNETILRNLAAVAAAMRCEPDRGRKLWIRTPLIHDATATTENLAAISTFIHDYLLDVVERWELCAFNSVCTSKYQKLGQTWAYEGYPLMGQKGIDTLKAAALSTGIGAEKLVVSGLFGKD